MIYSRYNDPGQVLKMPIRRGIELLRKAYEERNDQVLWEAYLTMLPKMDKKNHISFDDFKKKSMPKQKQVSDKSATEILARAEAIRKRDQSA